MTGYYNYLMSELSDPKTRNWLINKPRLLIPIMAAYLVFCLKLGPAYMKNRRPYNIIRLIQYYNISQVIINVSMLIEGIRRIQHYNYMCQPIDYSMNPMEIRVTFITWWYSFSKLYDLLDTIFFILKKNFRQVTTLHVYHHVLMGGGLVYMTNFYSCGHLVPAFGLNVIVHIFMYTYYFIASLGPEYRQYLWWKRHLTELQLLQFFLGASHSVLAYIRGCDIPLTIVIYFIFQAYVFIQMFGSFYLKTYVHAPVVREHRTISANREKHKNNIQNGGTKYYQG